MVRARKILTECTKECAATRLCLLPRLVYASEESRTGIPLLTHQLVAADKRGSALLFITPEGTIVRALEMPSPPHEIVLSADKRRAFVSMYGTGTFGNNPDPGFEIQVMDLETSQSCEAISIAPYNSPHGLTFDSFGALWTSCDRHGVVLAISIATGTVLGSVETGSHGTHWVLGTPDGRKLFTSNKHDPFIGVIDPKRKQMTRKIAVPHGVEGLCFSPDGRWLFAADRCRPEVLRIDAEREELVETIVLKGLEGDRAISPHHMRLRVSPDGRVLAVAAHHYDRLVLLQTADLTQQKTLVTGKGPMALAFLPDHRSHLYLSNHDEGTLSIVDIAQMRILQTLPCGHGVESMEFFPCGDQPSS
jgi:DNA-binding beta-propeller fold protein YncE